MLRISRICMLLCLLTGILMSACSNNPSLNTPIPSPTLPVVEEWFGMQISSDLWHAEEVDDAIYQHGVLTHQTLSGCRALILSEEPPSIANYDPDWDNSIKKTFDAAEIRLDLRRMKDKDGNLKDIYFEVTDISGQSGFDLYRLAYVLVEPGDSPIQCIDAVNAVLSSIKPELFPKLDIGQG